MTLCEKHPTYKAKRPPKVKCDECRLAWLDARLDALGEEQLELGNEREEILNKMIDDGRL